LDEDWKQIEERFERMSGDIERPLMKPRDLFAQPAQALAALEPYARIQVAHAGAEPVQTFSAGADRVRQLIAEGQHRILFVAESPGRREALLAWLKPQGITPREIGSFREFLDHDKRFAVALGPIQDAYALPD